MPNHRCEYVRYCVEGSPQALPQRGQVIAAGKFKTVSVIVAFSVWIHLADRECNARLCMATERSGHTRWNLSLNHTCQTVLRRGDFFSMMSVKYFCPSLFAYPTARSSVKLADGWCLLEMEISMHTFQEGITMPFHELSYDSRGDQQGVEVANCGLDTRDRNR